MTPSIKGSIAQDVKAALQAHAKPNDVPFLQRFFKTGAGEYAAGDVFIGVRVPPIRLISKQFSNLPLTEVQRLLKSKVHEHRLAALIILTIQYPAADKELQHAIYDFYLLNARNGHINNWDLVDVSAEFIIGEYLKDKPRDILFELAASTQLWERRIAIVSSFQFIKANDPSTTLELAVELLYDTEDLIKKAVGWMLREVGKRCGEKMLTDFLDTHAADMPRTMLRYSIERLTPTQRIYYMRQK